MSPLFTAIVVILALLAVMGIVVGGAPPPHARAAACCPRPCRRGLGGVQGCPPPATSLA